MRKISSKKIISLFVAVIAVIGIFTYTKSSLANANSDQDQANASVNLNVEKIDKDTIISLFVAVIAVIGIFTYTKSSLANANSDQDQANASVNLNVEKIDKDTIRISLDNFTPVIKSLQLGVNIDGDVNFTEDTINWLVSSDDENLKSNVKISDDKKNMDIFIVSTEALNKVGGKLEICEIDVNKSAGASAKYNVIPNDYSYLLNDTNKQISGIDIANLDENGLTLNSAPKLELANHPSIIEGKVVISKDDKFEPLDYVIATDDEEGEIDKSKITVTKNEVKTDTVGSYNIIVISKDDKFEPLDYVIATDDEEGEIDKSKITVTKNEVKTDTVGSYNISYSVEDSEGEVATLDTTVIVEAKPTEEVQKPVITVTNKTINTTLGEEVDLLDGVNAVDYLGREIQVVEAKPTEEVQKPVITVTNKTINTTLGEEVDLLDGVNAVDYLGREIQVKVSGDYEFNKVGTYTIQYNATDRFGNKADEVTSTLVVEEVDEKPEVPDEPENPDQPEVPGEPENPEISLPDDIINIGGNGTEESPMTYKTENLGALNQLVEQVQDKFKVVVLNRTVLNDGTQKYSIRLDKKGIITRLLGRANSLPDDIINIGGNGTEESPMTYKTENLVALNQLFEQVKDTFKVVVLNRTVLND